MVSSTRLDVVVQQVPCVRDVLPIVSGRCRATIRARRATTSSQRSRCPSTRSRLASALQPSRVATIPHSQWHFTAPPPLTSPCTASRAFNGEGRLTLGAWTTCRAARGGQRCPPAQTSSDRLRCDHFSTARVTCVPAGPRRSGLQQCQPRVVCATEAPRDGGAVSTVRRIDADRPACICRVLARIGINEMLRR